MPKVRALALPYPNPSMLYARTPLCSSLGTSQSLGYDLSTPSVRTLLCTRSEVSLSHTPSLRQDPPMTQGRTLLHSKPGPFCDQLKTILSPWLGPPSVGNMSSGQCQSEKSRATTEMTLEFLRRKTPYRGLRVIITFSMRCAATKTRRFEARPSARLSTNLFFPTKLWICL